MDQPCQASQTAVGPLVLEGVEITYSPDDGAARGLRFHEISWLCEVAGKIATEFTRTLTSCLFDCTVRRRWKKF